MPPTNRNDGDRLQAIEDKADKILAILNGDNSGNGIINRLTKEEYWTAFFGALMTVISCLTVTNLGLVIPWYFHSEK